MNALSHKLPCALLALLVTGLWAPRPAAAAGFLVYDISGEALAQASAVAAHTSEPAAIWFNPAGLSFAPGYAASAGGTVVLARNHFKPAAGGDTIDGKAGTFFLPMFFAAGQVHERVHVGIGGYTAFGLGIEWPEDWVGREYALKASIQTFTLNPTVSIKLLDNLALGVGFQAVRGAVDFTNGIPTIGGDVRIAGGAWGYGGNVGLQYRLLPQKLSFGLTYRSRVKLDFAGRAEFNAPIEFASQAALQSVPGSASITLPDVLTFAVACKPLPVLMLSFDANVTMWNTYDELKLTFANPAMSPSQNPKVMKRKNQAAGTFRFGADWRTPLAGVNLRAGFIYDQNPAPKEYLSPSLPDANRVDFALGAGLNLKHFKLDAGYLLVYFLPSEARKGVDPAEGPDGTYNSIAHLIGVTATVKWGGAPAAHQAAAFAP